MSNVDILPPIDPDKGEWDDVAISRRKFLTMGFMLTTAVTGLTVGGAGATYLVGNTTTSAPGNWVKVGKVEELKPGAVHQSNYSFMTTDAWRKVEQKGLLYAFSDDGAEYTVLSATCSHLGCNVHWKEGSGQFACPCHDGHFARDGQVISGPPPRPLTRLQSKVENGVLLALV